jgi:hypothetical protein
MDVLVNGKGAHREGDDWAVHCCGPSCHSGKTVKGSPNVFTNGKAKARIGDLVDCGSAISAGSSNVFLNEEGGKAAMAVNLAKMGAITSSLPVSDTAFNDKSSLINNLASAVGIGCQVEKLPSLVAELYQLGLYKAAELLAYWFDAKASTDKYSREAFRLDQDWLAQFDSFKLALEKLSRNFLTESSAQVLRAKTSNIGLNSGVFGPLSLSDNELEKWQIQYQPFEFSYLTEEDELYASIGRFNLYLSASGSYNQTEIQIDRVYMYLKDGFDFIDDGWLSQVLYHPLLRFSFFVDNQCFNDFRRRYGLGADFFVRLKEPFIYAVDKRISR